jgi:hypothetical protein
LIADVLALSEIIVAKREHREPPAAPEPDQPEGVLDLTAALNASVARARESCEDGTDADVHELTRATVVPFFPPDFPGDHPEFSANPYG